MSKPSDAIITLVKSTSIADNDFLGYTSYTRTALIRSITSEELGFKKTYLKDLKDTSKKIEEL
jgi:hypothetical protein